MSEIRYWDAIQHSGQVDRQGQMQDEKQIEKRSALSNFRAFEAMMMDTLMKDSVGSGVNSDYTDVFSSGLTSTSGSFGSFDSSMDILFGDLSSNTPDLERKIKNIQDQGMGKVLAARLSNPLPTFSQPQSDKNKNSGMNSLDNMISLTMQEHMLKARKVLQGQVKAFETFTRPDEVSNADIVAGYESLDEFYASIQQQIVDVANKFNVDEQNLKESLLLPKA